MLQETKKEDQEIIDEENDLKEIDQKDGVTGLGIIWETYSDAILLVGPHKKEIKVLKFVLQLQSAILKRRLDVANAVSRDQRQEQGKKLMEFFDFHDVHPEPFFQFIQYVHTSEWQWSGQVEDFVPMLSLWRLSVQLGVNHLEELIFKCLESIAATPDELINVSTACRIFQEAGNFGASQVKERALDLIRRCAVAVFDDLKNYEMLTAASFQEILGEDGLVVKSELETFKAVLRWGSSKCEKADSKPGNLEEVVRNVLLAIRFTQMTQSEFMAHVFPFEVLSDAQIGKILPVLYGKMNGSEILNDLERPRKYLEQTTFDPQAQFTSAFQAANIEQMKKLLSTTEIYGLTPKQKFDLELTTECMTSDSSTAIPKLQIHSPNSSPMDQSRVVLITNDMTEEVKSQFCAFVQAVKEWCAHDLFLELTIQSNLHVLDDLYSFLEFTVKNNLITELKLTITSVTDQIACTNLPPPTAAAEGVAEILPKFPHIKAIDFRSVFNDTEFTCLTQLVQNCPNLSKISLGNFDMYAPPLCNWPVLKFFQMPELKNVEMSVAHFNASLLPVTLLTELKAKNVFFKRVNFSYTARDNQLLLDTFQDHLEDIGGVFMKIKNVTAGSFSKLKSLQLYYDVDWLFAVLQKSPGLQRLSVRPVYASSPPPNLVQLPVFSDLTCLCLDMLNGLADLNPMEHLLAKCPNIKIFRLRNLNQVKTSWFYPLLPKLEELQLFSLNKVFPTEAICGVEQAQLTDAYKVPGNGQRPPYIGNLKGLRKLVLGPSNYDATVAWSWNIDHLVWTHAICHVATLDTLVLPPMTYKDSEYLLDFLSENIPTLQLVIFQFWARTTSDPLGRMCERDISKLGSCKERRFSVKSERVEQTDSEHPADFTWSF